MRRWVEIQPTILWLCWQDENGRIPKSAPPIPAQAKSIPKFRRQLDEIYELALFLLVSDHILAAKSISMDEVTKGHWYLTMYNHGAVKLGIPLVINNHLAMHYPSCYRFGPTYTWWLYGFERCNGDQKKVNLNGHADSEMELTLARDWVQKHCLYELVSRKFQLNISHFIIGYRLRRYPRTQPYKNKNLLIV